MKTVLLVSLLLALLPAMTIPAGAAEISAGIARFADDSTLAVAADLAQPIGSLKGNPITVDALILSTGDIAGAVSIKANLGNFKVSLGFAPGAKAPTFSKDTWKNFLGALQYTLITQPAPAALGFLPTDPPAQELNVGIVHPPFQTARAGLGLVGAEYVVRW